AGAAELDHLGLAHAAAVIVAEDHVGLHHLAPVVVGHADHRGEPHRGVLVERLLHLARPHLEARAVDDVLLAVDHREVALAVHHRHVAGVEPPVAHHLGGGGVAPPRTARHLPAAHWPVAGRPAV